MKGMRSSIQSLQVQNMDQHLIFPLIVTPCFFLTSSSQMSCGNFWSLRQIDTLDKTKEEIRCFTGFLFGISINKVAEINDIWSSDWVAACPAFVCFFTKDRFWALWTNIHLADNEKAPPKESPAFDKLYKVRPIMKFLENLSKKTSILDKMSVSMKQW